MRLKRPLSEDDEGKITLEALRREVKEEVLSLMDLDGLNSESFLIQFHMLLIEEKKQLQAMCKTLHVPISGNKQYICHRILKTRNVFWKEDFSTYDESTTPARKTEDRPSDYCLS